MGWEPVQITRNDLSPKTGPVKREKNNVRVSFQNHQCYFTGRTPVLHHLLSGEPTDKAEARWQILWKNEVDEIIPLIKSDLAYLKDLVGFTDSYQNGADTRMQENPCQRHLGECLPAFLSNIIQFSYLEYRLFCDIVCSQENS